MKKEKNELRFDEIKQYCEKQSKDAMQNYMFEIKKEMEKNEEIVDKLMKWNYQPKNPDFEKKKNWRQDKTKYGVKTQLSAKQLLNIQMQSNDVSFHPKFMFDFDVYLSELLTTAHSMDQKFQNFMKEILVTTNSVLCEFGSGPIKSHDRCKMKAQIEYRDCEFPKSAHIIDIIRCQATFQTFQDLKHGLDHFVECIENKFHEYFEIMRIKNGFFEINSSQLQELKTEKEEKEKRSQRNENFKIEVVSSTRIQRHQSEFDIY